MPEKPNTACANREEVALEGRNGVSPGDDEADHLAQMLGSIVGASNAPAAISEALYYLQQKTRTPRASSITLVARDRLCETLEQARGVVLGLFGDHDRALVNTALEAAAGLLWQWAETPAEREARHADVHLDLHAFVRWLRNACHNLSLLREVEHRQAAREMSGEPCVERLELHQQNANLTRALECLRAAVRSEQPLPCIIIALEDIVQYSALLDHGQFSGENDRTIAAEIAEVLTFLCPRVANAAKPGIPKDRTFFAMGCARALVENRPDALSADRRLHVGWLIADLRSFVVRRELKRRGDPLMRAARARIAWGNPKAAATAIQ